MNKFLAFIYFFLLFSYSLCKECTKEDCNFSSLEEGQIPNYVCVPKEGDSCGLELCSKT